MAVTGIITVAYAWWATGVAPFTTASYALVAVPWILAVVAYASEGYFVLRRGDFAAYFRQRALGVTRGNTSAWLVCFAAVVALESVGLALGGRSNRVPTLSTVVDHLLVTHVGRCALFCTWVAVGARPLVRLRRWRGDGAA
jgi:hypothetical protein